MNSYKILLRILAKIIEEAPSKYSKLYEKDPRNVERYNSSLSRAYIHMFLKVKFDLLDFEEREYYITDGGNDGGVDGYYIDRNNKCIYLIQSKFRLSEKNFEEKEISVHELLAMEINRILKGETEDQKGNSFRGKILQLQRDIKEIDDLPRYDYKVIILANLKDLSNSDVERLTSGYKVEIVDYEKCYKDFVFPIVSGSHFAQSDLIIQIDLSNKLANKISYQVTTEIGECDITVLFVPTLEIGKFMSKYKNSILQYNPRSYLGFKSQDVNKKIAESITQRTTNEFALFNNGITLLSEETFINENVAQRGVAKLIVKNPQIINGGQTSFTLSRIYEETKDESLFDKKEVLLKIITVPSDLKDKAHLIDMISDATNHQTPVGPSDRISNLKEQVELQNIVFEKFGMYYERKRGEFYDGVFNGYVDSTDIIDRSLFIKIYYVLSGNLKSLKTGKIFVSHKWTSESLSDIDMISSTLFGCKCYQKLQYLPKYNASDLDMLAKVKAMVLLYFAAGIDFDLVISNHAADIAGRWKDFLTVNSDKVYRTVIIKDPTSNTERLSYNWSRSKMRSWLNSDAFDSDVKAFFARG